MVFAANVVNRNRCSIPYVAFATNFSLRRSRELVSFEDHRKEHDMVK